MTYTPFDRGSFAVGVRTLPLVDAGREHRSLPTEVWYPATAQYRGQDVVAATWDTYEMLPGFPPASQEAVRDAAPRAGTYPLVCFSHGFGGHRRQSTFLCTHLASHGYVVAAVDHTGNTIGDMLQLVMATQGGGPPPDLEAITAAFIEARPLDIGFLIDHLLAPSSPAAGMVDADRIGMSGHSFGGWTTLATVARDARIRAALPLAPAGGATDLPIDTFETSLSFDWGRDVPTLYLVAERDSLLPLAGMHDLFRKTRGPKQLVVLMNADHMHFCDRVDEVHEFFRTLPLPGNFGHLVRTIPPIGGLCPAEHAYDFVRGLGLAHMDAHLKDIKAARRFLRADLPQALRARGIEVTVS